ncbi:hypothetical protein GCM10010360_58580 [Streptomyces nogalater]
MARVRRAVAAAVACPLCPRPNEADAKIILASYRIYTEWHVGTIEVYARAKRLVGDDVWRENALSWVDDFNREHGHGPTWDAFRCSDTVWCEPWEEISPAIRSTILPVLAGRGYLDGMRTPYSMCRSKRSESTKSQQASCVLGIEEVSFGTA